MPRWLRFLIAIAIGLGLGLAYGWLVDPVQFVDTTPASLSPGYRADYVLTVAEAFAGDGDLLLAAERLDLLARPPSESLAEALQTAAAAGYSAADIQLLQRLSDALGGRP